MTGQAAARTRYEAVFWVALLCGLLAGIGYETDWGKRWVWPIFQSEVSPAPFDNPQLTKPFALGVPDTFIEIAMRPLFVSTRRPAPTLPDTPKQTMRKGQFILAGTTIVGEVKFAHLIEKTGEKPRVVAEGKEINGILLRKVDPTSVVLSQYDETEVVILQAAKPPASAANAKSASPPSNPGRPGNTPSRAIPLAPPPSPQPQTDGTQP